MRWRKGGSVRFVGYAVVALLGASSCGGGSSLTGNGVAQNEPQGTAEAIAADKPVGPKKDPPSDKPMGPKKDPPSDKPMGPKKDPPSDKPMGMPKCNASFTNASDQAVTFYLAVADSNDWREQSLGANETREYEASCESTLSFRIDTMLKGSPEPLIKKYSVPMGKRLVIRWNTSLLPAQWDLQEINDK